MFEKSFYTIRELADELNIGESTIRYWQDQFNAWIPCTGRGREKWYPKIVIEMLRFIMQQADAGRNGEEIENELKRQYHKVPKGEDRNHSFTEDPDEGIGMNPTAARGIRDLLDALTTQQKRIADAQEKRTAAEERKAVAIEQNTQTYQKMARALEEIAKALKLGTRPESIQAQENDLLERIKPGRAPRPDIRTEPPVERPSMPLFETDGLTDLIEPLATAPGSQTDTRTEPFVESQPTPLLETDDLADLIEPLATAPGPQADVRTEPPVESPSMPLLETDDLVDLIEPLATTPGPQADKPKKLPENAEPAPAAAPKQAKPTTVPDDYKSKMIAVIIGMKEKQKLSIADTVERLNKKGYKPLSGDDQWSHEAIEQIYSHIDLVRVAREQRA